MTRRHWLPLVIPIAFMLSSTSAAAQTGTSRFALGGNVSFKSSTEQESGGGIAVGLLWRLGKGRQGWGPTYGLSWYSAQFQATINGEPQSFGEMKLRPLMIGYGYSRTIRRVHASANVLAGFALTSFSLSPIAHDALSQELAAPSLHTTVSNPTIVRPEINLWVNVSRRVGVNVNAGYMIAHPRVRVESPNGQIQRNMDADVFTLAIGAAYSIF